MKHQIPHGLSFDLAKRAAQSAVTSYQARFTEYKATGIWTTDTRCDVRFVAAGRNLSGTIEVNPRSIDLDLDVPMLLLPFKAMAMKVIEEEVRDWIAKAKAGQLG